MRLTKRRERYLNKRVGTTDVTRINQHYLWGIKRNFFNHENYYREHSGQRN